MKRMGEIKKKPEKPVPALKIDAKISKSASNKEMLHYLVEKTDKQEENLGNLGVKVAKLEQQVGDFITHHDQISKEERKVEREDKVEKTKEGYKKDWRLMAGWLLTIILFVIKLVWDAWPR